MNAEALLERLNLGPVVPSKLNPDCPCVVLPDDEAARQLRNLRLPTGLVAFMGAYSEISVWYPERSITTFRELVVGPGEHRFDVVKLARTGVNSGVDLGEWLHRWDARYGVDLVLADQSTVSFRLTRMPEDLSDFVKELYRVAPDSVDLGYVGSLENWVEMIQKDQSVGLLWI